MIGLLVVGLIGVISLLLVVFDYFLLFRYVLVLIVFRLRDLSSLEDM